MRKDHDRHGLLVCALVATVCGCARSSAPAVEGTPPSFVYKERMGIARWRENRGCLAVFNSSVTPGTRVTLVDQPASSEAPSVKEASVAERVSQGCDASLSYSQNGVAPSLYQLARADGTEPSTGILVAILDSPSPVLVRDGHVEADFDRDGAMESFRVCTSAENVHFMVWTGSPAQGRPRWHGNYYVAYDMVPSCTDQDVAGMELLQKQGKPGR